MAEQTKQELYEEEQKKGIEGRSTMSKEELETAIQELKSSEPPPVRPTGRWLHDHLLSIALLGLFVLSFLGQLYFQFQHETDEALQHGEEPLRFFSSEFWVSFLASVFENWQSEFLQVLAFVVLATYLIHRGSPQSRDGADEMAQDVKAILRKLEADN